MCPHHSRTWCQRMLCTNLLQNEVTCLVSGIAEHQCRECRGCESMHSVRNWDTVQTALEMLSSADSLSDMHMIALNRQTVLSLCPCTSTHVRACDSHMHRILVNPAFTVSARP